MYICDIINHMRRLAYKQLLAWKAKKYRKPLIIKGARQVGKTHLLTTFAKEEFSKHHYFNFELDSALSVIFEKNLDPIRVIKELAFHQKCDIDINKDVVIFDEIQACQKALTSLKYFNEQMSELAICAAGSLLGIHLSKGSFPVGQVDWLALYPLTFEEFLLGVGDDRSVAMLQESRVSHHIPDVVHQHLWEQLKTYFVVGGLPEVIMVYKNNDTQSYDSLDAVRQVQSRLIDAYYADIAKHSGKINAMHIDRVWRSVPAQLMNTIDGSANKYKFKGVIPGINRYSSMMGVFDWLENAGLILKTHIVNHIEHPLSAYVKENSFKVFMFDVGLLGAMARLAPTTILSYDYGTYKGYFAENYVAQAMTTAFQQPLISWQAKVAEVEFVREVGGHIIPVEVKAGNVAKAKSLKSYCHQYAPKNSVILSARNMRVDVDNNLWQLPLYCAHYYIE